MIDQHRGIISEVVGDVVGEISGEPTALDATGSIAEYISSVIRGFREVDG
jgi:hypothetical protein